jgi:PPM family protein phosphatase
MPMGMMTKLAQRLRALMARGNSGNGYDGSEAQADGAPDEGSSLLNASQASGLDDALSRPVVGEDIVSARRGCIRVGSRTDLGRVREHNEDAVLVMLSHLDVTPTSSDFGLFMVADGMGGHQKGEAASALAIRIAAEYLVGQVYVSLLSGADRGANQPVLTDVVRDAIVYANRIVSRELPGSGCTLTCGMVVGGRLFIGHVGDSRAYIRRADGGMVTLTTDHSLVNRLIEIGQLSADEAADHPQRNVLYRAIGQPEALEVDVVTYPFASGDRLLLCSDGLWNLVPDAEISEMAGMSDPQSGCDALVEAANAAGGIDNISVVLVALTLD